MSRPAARGGTYRRERFDVAVVGARCAGATLATFLARAGARVLLVDRATLPSDQVLSTHTIHPPGVDVLDELGVGDEVRSRVRASPTIRLRKGDAWVDLSFPHGRAELCPRRKRLDGLLQEAAAESGADLRDRTRATRVEFEDGRAVGVRVEHGGREEEIRAGLVVGADGRRSLVASQVGAEEYMAYDAPRAMYWAYWDAPREWTTDRYPFDVYIGHVGADIRAIFQTDDEQLLIGSLPPVRVARTWSREARAALKRNLAEGPVTGPLVEGADPEGSVRGTLKERYFFRRGAGPGWALVGDAGHHKEFVVGDGITEALIQARSLAEAIREGGDRALVHWWRRRDVEALPTYFWGRDEGSLEPPSRLEALVLERVARDERLERRMTRLPEHECSPYEAVPVGVVLSALARALVKGRFEVIPEFAAQVRRMARYRRALRERERLLSEVREAEPAE